MQHMGQIRTITDKNITRKTSLENSFNQDLFSSDVFFLTVIYRRFVPMAIYHSGYLLMVIFVRQWFTMMVIFVGSTTVKPIFRQRQVLIIEKQALRLRRCKAYGRNPFPVHMNSFSRAPIGTTVQQGNLHMTLGYRYYMLFFLLLRLIVCSCYILLSSFFI